MPISKKSLLPHKFFYSDDKGSWFIWNVGSWLSIKQHGITFQKIDNLTIAAMKNRKSYVASYTVIAE